jgi:hypothetical protein
MKSILTLLTLLLLGPFTVLSADDPESNSPDVLIYGATPAGIAAALAAAEGNRCTPSNPGQCPVTERRG